MTFDTDVLVIGAGLAGLRAAAAARLAGARVVLVAKGKVGRSGASAITTGYYAAALADSSSGDTAEVHEGDTIRGGYHLADPRLVEVLCAEAPDGLRDLETAGAGYRYAGSTHELARAGEHTYARSAIPLALGTGLTLPLVERLDGDCVLLEDTLAVDLLEHAGQVVGALLWRRGESRFLALTSRATVLATGGVGRLYSVTSNPRDVTGDGFALAVAAGARLRDMEFVQFLPWRCIYPFVGGRVVIQPSTFLVGARLYNRTGTRFMAEFDADRLEATTRDRAARGLAVQLERGEGLRGGARLDLGQVAASDLQETSPRLSGLLEKKGLNYREAELIVGLESHYMMGGVAVDEHGGTGVPGLFAAGETTGGVHGANRLSDNALPDTQVFGSRAGKAAASVNGPEGGVPDDVGQRRADAWLAALRDGPPIEAAELDQLLSALRSEAWHSIGVLREATTLRAGTEFFRNLQRDLVARSVEPTNFRLWWEVFALARAGEIVAQSALARGETRGAQVRWDHPSAGAELNTVWIEAKREDIRSYQLAIRSRPWGAA